MIPVSESILSESFITTIVTVFLQSCYISKLKTLATKMTTLPAVNGRDRWRHFYWRAL